MVSIILVEPEHPGNVGAIARIMKNFGIEDLILVNPQCDPQSPEAQGRAMHGKDILAKAKTIHTLEECKKYCSTLISTTAKIGKDPHLIREAIPLHQMMQTIKEKKNVGIIFGREGSGLTNEEIKQCDFTITIPATKTYPTLNVSHAVGIVCYEYFTTQNKEHQASHIIPATPKEKERVLLMLEECLSILPFKFEKKRETQRRVWKRLVGKSFLTKQEAFTLFGFFKRIAQGEAAQQKKGTSKRTGKD